MKSLHCHLKVFDRLDVDLLDVIHVEHGIQATLVQMLFALMLIDLGLQSLERSFIPELVHMNIN